MLVSFESATNDTEARAEQLPKALMPRLVTRAGIVMDVRAELANAFLPILVSFESTANVTEVREVQLIKAFWFILVTEAGMMMDVRPELRNVFVSIIVSDAGSAMDVKSDKA